MCCNCGKAAAQQQYLYTAPDGKQTHYTSEVQARAAQIRNSGGHYVSVPK